MDILNFTVVLVVQTPLCGTTSKEMLGTIMKPGGPPTKFDYTNLCKGYAEAATRLGAYGSVARVLKMPRRNAHADAAPSENKALDDGQAQELQVHSTHSFRATMIQWLFGC